MLELLNELSLGSSVAEHDELLERYFVETNTFRRLVEDEGDIIAGDKGTGKTALYRILNERHRSIPALSNVEIIPAFNPIGTPVFQRLNEDEPLTESQYIGVWKAYFLSLVGNWVLSVADGDYDNDLEALDGLLSRVGLRTPDDKAQTVFSQLANRLRSLIQGTKSAEVSAGIVPPGIPIIGARLEFGQDAERQDLSRHDDALRLLNQILTTWETPIWVVIDRLDEAFQGSPVHERPVLRALFRTYLDMLEFENIRLKLFVRRDLFSRITSNGFVNLTHINSRRIDIIWDDEDLYSLLARRLEDNQRLAEKLCCDNEERTPLFELIFPEKVDQTEKRPTTWNWMLSRIRDGNDVKPPRNLIDLVIDAREAQIRQEERSPRDYSALTPVIVSESLKRGLELLSSRRVEDTLLAEAGELAAIIELFRGGKSEHNRASLQDLLSPDWQERVRLLQVWGFLEPVGSNYKVPMIWRSGMQITQGKAFSTQEQGAL